MTIGKTHSGKSTFAKSLEGKLQNSFVLDQDNHAVFIHSHYQKLQPSIGTNTLKYGLSKYILEYAIQQTTLHIILCSSNRHTNDRIQLLNTYFPKEQFIRIIVHFDIEEKILFERIQNTNRTTTIFRDSSMSFDQLLTLQHHETKEQGFDTPTKAEAEAEHIFTLQSKDDEKLIIHEIVQLAKQMNFGI